MTQIPLGPGAEFDLIRRFYPLDRSTGTSAHLPDAVRVGAGDDCAIVRGEGVALSMDISVEGVHFLREWLEPEEIGYRAAGAALSDLAAVAATPIGVLAALAIDESDLDVAARIMDGVRAAAAGARAVLLGGDMSRTSGPMVVDIVVAGNALRPVLRTGARAGDSLWVTGELGAAAAAVRAWKMGAAPEQAARLAFALPAPRIAEAIWLATRGVLDAMIDVSDGIAGDVEHLAAASGVRMIIDAASIPIHPTVHVHTPDHDHALRLALTGGEDYELCFAAPPGAVERIVDAFVDTFDVPLTCIGTVHSGSGVLLRSNGTVTELPWSGHDHFTAQ